MIKPFTITNIGHGITPFKIINMEVIPCTSVRNYSDIGDYVEMNELRPLQWQLKYLKKNPEYNSWGNGEDYMWASGSYNSPIVINSVDELWKLDDYNEVVNFYFNVVRYGNKCEYCNGSGFNVHTNALDNSWDTWKYNLTEVEIDALVKRGRLWDLMGASYRYDEAVDKWYKYDNKFGFIANMSKIEVDTPIYPTPEEVNEWAANTLYPHDSTNAYICIKARGEHLGVYGYCPYCNGTGNIHTHSNATLGLQLWIIHPRKGASRGVYLKEIKEHEIPIVLKYLREARDRNSKRFSNI